MQNSKQNSEDYTLIRCIVTFIIISLTGFCAYLFPNIYDSYTLISGPSKAVITIVFPGLLGLKLIPENSLKKYFTILMIIVTTVMGMNAAIITLLQLTKLIQLN